MPALKGRFKDPDLLTTGDLARELDMDICTIRLAIKNGILPEFTRTGRRWVVTRKDAEKIKRRVAKNRRYVQRYVQQNRR